MSEPPGIQERVAHPWIMRAAGVGIPERRNSLATLLVIPAKEGVEKHLFAVIPAKAGIPKHLMPRDSCRSLPPQFSGGGRND